MISHSQYAAMFKKIAATSANYAECLKLERTDGTTLRYTSHDKPLHVKEEDGRLYWYKPAGKLQLTAVESTLGLSVTNYQFTAHVEDDSLLSHDLEIGVYAEAKIQVYIVSWKNSRVAALPIKVGWIGDIIKKNGTYQSDIRGIAQLLAQQFLSTTSLECRHVFGDTKCGVLVSEQSSAFTVNSVQNSSEFTVTPSAEAGSYSLGEARFTGGINSGRHMEILAHSGSSIELFLPSIEPISVGDTVTLVTGCNKTYARCKEFSNSSRFGGEPFLQTSDNLFGGF